MSGSVDQVKKATLMGASSRSPVLISDAQRQALRADIRQRLVAALTRSGDAVTDPKLARLPGPIRKLADELFQWRPTACPTRLTLSSSRATLWTTRSRCCCISTHAMRGPSVIARIRARRDTFRGSASASAQNGSRKSNSSTTVTWSAPRFSTPRRLDLFQQAAHCAKSAITRGGRTSGCSPTARKRHYANLFSSAQRSCVPIDWGSS